MKRISVGVIVMLGFCGVIQPTAFASAGPTGETCSTYLQVKMFGGFNYVCTKAPGSKKLVWGKPQPVSKLSTPKKTNNFALACAAWSKGDNRTFAKYLALLLKEGPKYREFVEIGFEHVTPHMTNPNGTGPSAYDLQQNINARNRILSDYCS